MAPAYLTATGSSGTGSRLARSGKSHHRRSGPLLVNKATRPELLVIDGDVLGAGAAAVNDGNQDYVAFWGYVLSVCREVRGNGLVPVIPCICLPEQLLSATTDETLHLLALLSDGETIPARIEARTGGDQLSLAKHLEFDANLRQARVPPPHTLLFLDVTTADEAGTIETSGSWAAAAIGGTQARSRRPSAPGPAGNTAGVTVRFEGHSRSLPLVEALVTQFYAKPSHPLETLASIRIWLGGRPVRRTCCGT